MKMNGKGQTAVEYLITTSFLLVVTGLIFAYALFIYTDSTAASTAKSAVSSIINTIDQVHALGPENVLYTDIEIPPNVSDVQYEDNANQTVTNFTIRIQTSGGLSDISKSSRGTFWMDETALCMLKKQGHYKLRVSWLSSDVNPTIVKVCADDGFGSCQTSCSSG